MAQLRFRTVKRRVLGFLGVTLLCIALSTAAGAGAHLLASLIARESYALAISDQDLPPSPVDSTIFAPFLIGATVAWWFGFIAAPFVYAGKVVGHRRSWKKPLVWFFVVGMVGWFVGTVWESRDATIDSGTALLVALLYRGDWILGAAFVAMALSRAKIGAHRSMVRTAQAE